MGRITEHHPSTSERRKVAEKEHESKGGLADFSGGSI